MASSIVRTPTSGAQPPRHDIRPSLSSASGADSGNSAPKSPASTPAPHIAESQYSTPMSGLFSPTSSTPQRSRGPPHTSSPVRRMRGESKISNKSGGGNTDVSDQSSSDLSTIANFLFSTTSNPPSPAVNTRKAGKASQAEPQSGPKSQNSRQDLRPQGPTYAELQAKLAVAEKKLAECEARLDQWHSAARDALNAVALSPSSNEKYKSEICEQLEKILAKLDQVKEVRYINCSFPAIQAQAPSIEMLSWTSLDKSDWSVRWKPSWSIEVSLDGQHYIPFRLLIRVSKISIAGNFELKLSPTIDYFWVSFGKDIKFDMSVDVEVTWGIVNVPLQATISAMVRKGFDDWLRNSLVEPNRMRFIGVPRKTNPGELSDEDVEKAKQAAELAMQRAPGLD